MIIVIQILLKNNTVVIIEIYQFHFVDLWYRSIFETKTKQVKSLLIPINRFLTIIISFKTKSDYIQTNLFKKQPIQLLQPIAIVDLVSQ